MKKLFYTLALTTLTLTPQAHAAAHPELEEALDPRSIVPTAISFLKAPRKIARDEFFKNLEAVKSTEPVTLGAARKRIRRALLNVILNSKNRTQAESMNLVDNHFGLSIQDLIDHNLLPHIRYGGLLELSQMYIDDISGIRNIRGSKNIKDLDLSHNNLDKIPSGSFANFTNLKELFLGYNKLRAIEPGAFAGPKNLIHLDLTNNWLRTRMPGAFKGLRQIKEFSLIGNRIADPTERLRIVTEVRESSPDARIWLDNQRSAEELPISEGGSLTQQQYRNLMSNK